MDSDAVRPYIDMTSQRSHAPPVALMVVAGIVHRQPMKLRLERVECPYLFQAPYGDGQAWDETQGTRLLMVTQASNANHGYGDKGNPGIPLHAMI